MRFEPGLKGKCTVIESMQGKVKLIQRIDESYSRLVTINFPSLKNCLEYAAKNQFQINIIYSGARKESRDA